MRTDTQYDNLLKRCLVVTAFSAVAWLLAGVSFGYMLDTRFRYPGTHVENAPIPSAGSNGVGYIFRGYGPHAVLKAISGVSSTGAYLEQSEYDVTLHANASYLTLLLEAALDIAIAETTGAFGKIFTVINMKPDQVVTMESPDGSIDIVADYPNFTLSYNASFFNPVSIAAGSGIAIAETETVDTRTFNISNTRPDPELTIDSPDGTISVDDSYPVFDLNLTNTTFATKAYGYCFFFTRTTTTAASVPGGGGVIVFNIPSTAGPLHNVIHTSPFRLTVQESGYYEVIPMFTPTHTGLSINFIVRILVNGVVNPTVWNIVRASNDDNSGTFQARDVSYVNLAAGDYVELAISTGGAASSQPMFMAYLYLNLVIPT
jgi:hypothetical protein